MVCIMHFATTISLNSLFIFLKELLKFMDESGVKLPITVRCRTMFSHFFQTVSESSYDNINSFLDILQAFAELVIALCSLAYESSTVFKRRAWYPKSLAPVVVAA